MGMNERREPACHSPVGSDNLAKLNNLPGYVLRGNYMKQYPRIFADIVIHIHHRQTLRYIFYELA